MRYLHQHGHTFSTPADFERLYDDTQRVTRLLRHDPSMGATEQRAFTKVLWVAADAELGRATEATATIDAMLDFMKSTPKAQRHATANQLSRVAGLITAKMSSRAFDILHNSR